MKWRSMLPNHLNPPDAVASALEAFRESIGCPDDALALRIVGSPWATRRTQKLAYDNLRRERPSASESDLIEDVYQTRRLSAQATGDRLPPLPASIRTLGGLVEFLIHSGSHDATPDPFGWGATIDEILEKADY